jgi:hypothetical protein
MYQCFPDYQIMKFDFFFFGCACKGREYVLLKNKYFCSKNVSEVCRIWYDGTSTYSCSMPNWNLFTSHGIRCDREIGLKSEHI